jgi:hypothetical protein
MIKISGMRQIDLPLTGGVDEISPVNKIDYKNALKMENFRISKDGKRVEKRLGLAEEVTNFAEDVYGYTTYYDSDSAFCQLAILESEIQRKVGAGAWAKIHDFASNVAHPVRPLEIQGKIFVIHENDSRMIHTDKADYQIGITAPGTVGTTPPTSVPTTTTTYSTETTATMPLNELMAYANQGAMDAVWTDGDYLEGASTLATSGPATAGPDADNKYMMFSAAGAPCYDCTSSGAYAKRSRTLTTVIGPKYTLEINMYGGGNYGGWYFRVNVYNGTFLLPIDFDYYGPSIQDSTGQRYSFDAGMGALWKNWKFEVDGTDPNAIVVKCYKDAIYKKSITYRYPTTSSIGLIELKQELSVHALTIYIDSIKIASTETKTVTTTTTTTSLATEAGKYRYALTYFRGGNYGCESNPLKSVVGAASFTGVAGHDDIDTGGTYTASSTKSFRVQIDTAGATDTIKWSEDGGSTWKSTGIPLIIGTIYLSYGITLTCTAKTGHTAGDYWDFTCTVWAGTPVEQVVNLASIPVSSDAQVTGRKLYRTTAGGSTFYWLATINDNTSTTFVDNIPDIALGAEMEEDHDLCPSGKFSAWWDERLWVTGDDIVYYSQILYPEHFDISARYITVQRGDMSDEITQLVAYKDSLYLFRKRSIYAIQKTVSGYGLFLITDDVGCIAPWSMVSVNNLLMFISFRGVELFNGTDVYGIEPSLPIDRTVKTIDTTKTDYICGMNYPEKREVWFSIPDRTSGSATTAVYHTVANAWYYFSFYKTPSCLVACYDANKNLVAKMGTRDGYLCLCESTYLDNATAITATYRKPWVESNETADIRRVEAEYEIPTGKALTVNIYVDFDKDVQRTDTLTGETISATDIELRRPHCDFSELGQRAKYSSVEFTNAENLGGNLKINEITLYVRDRAIKGKKYGD